MKWDRAGSNRRLTDFQSDALPTELRSRYWIANIEVFFISSKKKVFKILFFLFWTIYQVVKFGLPRFFIAPIHAESPFFC